MFKRRNIYLNNKKGIRIVSIIVLLCVFFLTIGFSSFSATGQIEDIMATVKPTPDARITAIAVNNTTNGGGSNSENYNVKNIFGTIELPNQNSQVTYKLDVTVFLSQYMKITGITGLNSKLTYELTQYNLGDVLCNSNDECNYGAVDEFYLTIKYAEGGYDGVETVFPFNIDFTFEEVNYVSRVGNNYYQSLQEAIDTVPTTGVQTTVILLKNTSEAFTVASGKNVILDLQNFTLSNDGVANIIINYGTIRISNGVMTSDTTQGMINNEVGGVLTIDGGRFIATGTRQVVYNNGGTLTIDGSAYLEASSNQRAPVQNLNSGHITILGGTIVSTAFHGVANTANLTIGVKDGNVSKTTPLIMGAQYGVHTTTNINFYDGIIKGKTAAFSSVGLVADVETNCGIVDGVESIDGVVYKTATLGQYYVVTFDANGGTVQEVSRHVEQGTQIGMLPAATRTDYVFRGWFTDPGDSGVEVTDQTVVNGPMDLYAHWIYKDDIRVAKIGNTEYKTLQAAVNAVPTNGTETTIQLLEDTKECISVSSTRKVIFDLNNKTVSNNGNCNVIKNYGTATISNGTVKSSAPQGAINNESGATLYVVSGNVTATGTRQAIYNDGGTLTISGGTLTSVTNERATVQNQASSTLTITGGTIISSKQQGVQNSGVLNIGIKDGNISTTAPVIIGYTYGVDNRLTFNYYDGILKGITDSITGNVNDIEQNSTITNSTEVINGDTYKVSILN